MQPQCCSLLAGESRARAGRRQRADPSSGAAAVLGRAVEAHAATARRRGDHLGHAGREHGRRPQVAQARPRRGLRRRHLLLEGDGAAPRVPHGQQPDAVCRHRSSTCAAARWCWTCRRHRTRSRSSAAPSTPGRSRSPTSGRAARTPARAASTSSCRPGYKEQPPAGYIVVPSPTVFIHVGPAADRDRQGHARGRRRLQPAAEDVPARGCRESAGQPLRRRLPARRGRRCRRTT